jgi:hypothetical protein
MYLNGTSDTGKLTIARTFISFLKGYNKLVFLVDNQTPSILSQQRTHAAI